MINFLSGILSELSDGLVTVDVGGVGYGVFMSATSLAKLPPLGSELRIYTFFSVTEDSVSLYGFVGKDELRMFKSLIRVNGVGPKGALQILGTLDTDELRMAIAFGDAKALSRAPGIGKKTAERIILDLKDKIGSMGLTGEESLTGPGPTGVPQSSQSAAGEAIEALSMLGYSRTEAGRAVSRVQFTADMPTEEILKLALKNINMG